jgi:SAM-dependent methyltransferase
MSVAYICRLDGSEPGDRRDAMERGIFPLTPELPLPAGVPRDRLYRFLDSVRVRGGPKEELDIYCATDFNRFVYTYGLVRDLQGACLELGANPYFTTMLLRQFTDVDVTLANYFGPAFADPVIQEVMYEDFETGARMGTSLESRHFDVEAGSFPLPSAAFDVVLFCEIIEHLIVDPLAALREIKRVLRPDGVLILTTPNVNRLENVARMIAGANIYDPYSGYGPHGRHNYEYNKHELFLVLQHLGFEILEMFSADVRENRAAGFCSVEALEPLLRFREHDLGQYIFVKARSSAPARERKPAFLYRSFPPDELE